MKFSSAQQSAISSRANAVVSAGAGSGKTSVLATRYVDLVLKDHLRIEEILTLTFTRKAATEMYERIYGALIAENDDPFVAQQVAEFDKATISTLDSFCATIARSGCTPFGIAPTFTVDEDAVARLCRDTALTFLRDRSASPAVLHLVELNGFLPLWEDAFARLASEYFTVATEFDVGEMLSHQQAYFGAAADHLMTEILETVNEIEGLDPGATCVRSGQELLIALELGQYAQNAPEQLANDAFGLLSKVAQFKNLSLRCGNSRAETVETYKEAVRRLRDLGPRLDDVLRTMTSWPLVRQTLELAAEFRDIVLQRKRESGVLSYQDVLDLAIAALLRDQDLRDFYKNRFRCIMIDEFQDNNDRQKQLLYLLAESPERAGDTIPGAADLHPGKLFFVGDEKQSIYRFRGADVSVFKRLAGELIQGGDAIKLRHNYRSEPGLIVLFNRLFADVFKDAAADYEATFEPLESRPPTPGVIATAELWSVAPPDRNDPDAVRNEDAEAFYIARYIGDAVSGESGRDMKLAPDGRSPTYRDFAILMRSSSHQIRLERMLRRHGIPYVADAARSLFLDAPVNDIYQILQLVVFPRDRIAYAGLLRSPIVGLSDDGLIQVLSQNQGPFEPCAALVGVDRHRFDRGALRYAELTALADSASIEDLLFHIWYRLGYRYHLLRQAEYAPYLEFYDYLVELSRRHSNRGLASFLDELRGYLGQNLRLDDLTIMRDEQNGVHLMTIHKAKGLEFPVVIIPFASSRGQTDAISSSPFYWSPDHGLSFSIGKATADDSRLTPVNYLYRSEREARLVRDEAELKRLLYVAVTRAQSHLVISGVSDARENTFMDLVSSSFQDAAAAQDSDVPLRITVQDRRSMTDDEIDTSTRQVKHSNHRRIADLAEQYASLRIIHRSADRSEFSVTELNDAYLSLPGEADETNITLSDTELPIDALLERESLEAPFGSLCHHLMERFGNHPETEPIDADRLILPAGLRPPLSREEYRLYVGAALSMIGGYRASDLSRRISSAKRQYEIPFLIQVTDNDRSLWVRGQIDLVAQFDDSIMVVDFKTDRVLVPDHYELQLGLYRRAAQSIFGAPATSFLFHLRSAKTFELSDEVSAAEIMAVAKSL